MTINGHFSIHCIIYIFLFDLLWSFFSVKSLYFCLEFFYIIYVWIQHKWSFSYIIYTFKFVGTFLFGIFLYNLRLDTTQMVISSISSIHLGLLEHFWSPF